MLLETSDKVATLRLNRPEKLNAWGSDMESELIAALSEVRADPSIYACVLTGTGSRAFSSGANRDDLHARAQSREDQLRSLEQTGHPVFEALLTFPKPLLAAVNGYAVGFGFLASICCDICLASQNATFILPHVQLGLIPAYGGLARLAQWVGRGRALEIALTGRRISAEEAMRIGIVSGVFDGSELLSAAYDMAKQLAELPELSVRVLKESVYTAFEVHQLRNVAMADTYRFMALKNTGAGLNAQAAWGKRKGDSSTSSTYASSEAELPADMRGEE